MRALRGWVPFGVAALVIVGIPLGIALGIHWYQASGATMTYVQPEAVRLPKAGQDPRTLSVEFTWSGGGYCFGEFQAQVFETATSVVVGPVIDRQFHHGGACAGVGTVYDRASVGVTLRMPLGTRSPIRRSDGAFLPIFGPGDFLVPGGADRAAIQRFGGLNDSPPLGLRKSTVVTNLGDLADLTNALNVQPPYRQGEFYCPMDDGSYFLVDLHYPAGFAERLRVDATGCGAIYLNGASTPVAATAQARDGGELSALLDGLLGA